MTTARAQSVRARDPGATGAAVGAVQLLAALLAAGVTACATATPTGTRSSPARASNGIPAAKARPSAAAPAPRPTPPAAARPSFLCGPADPEWEEWFDDMFGTLARTVPLTLDPKRLQDLIESAQVEAEAMLRRGLQACDPLAVVAIDRADWRQLRPDLSSTIGANNAAFALQTIVTLRKFGDTSDYSDVVLAALTADSEDDRASAAEGARFFSLARMREPLLERVRRDPSWEVRFHAAESLLDLADVYPRDLSDHPALEKELRGDPGVRSRKRTIDSPPPIGPTQTDEPVPFAGAASALDRIIAERLAGGPCPPPAPLGLPRVRAVPVNEGLIALTAESRIGACERHLAFVVFVPSAGGTAALSPAGPGDGRALTLRTRPHPLTVEYRLDEAMLLVGSVRL